MKFTKNQQGAIAVFISLILFLMFVFSAIIVDGSRIYAGKNIVSGAGQLALNSGLSTYDEALKDAYGLIAMSEDVEELEANLNEYFVASLGTCGISEEDYNTALVFLQMAAEEGSFDAKAVPKTEVCRGYVMEQQVLDYMKFRAPITFGMGIYDKLTSAKEMEVVKTVANDELETAKAANDIQKHLEKLKQYVDDENKAYNSLNTAFSTMFDNMRKNAQTVTAAQLLLSGYENNNFTAPGSAWDELINQFIALNNSVQGTLNGGDKLAAYTNSYDSFMELKKYYNALKDLSEDEFMDYWCELNGISDEGDSSDDDSESEESEESEGDEDAEEALKEEGKQLYANFKAAKSAVETTVGSTIPADITNRLESIQNDAKSIYDATKEGVKQAKNIGERIEKIRKKLRDMEDKLVIWEADAERLSNPDLIEQNKTNRDQYKNLIEGDGMGKLEKQAEENKAFYEALKIKMEKAQFAMVSIRSVSSSAGSVRSEIAKHSGSVTSGTALKSFVEGNSFMLMYDLYSVKEEHNFSVLHNLKELEFYKELEQACGKGKDKKGIDSANEELDGQLETLMNELTELMTSNDLDPVKDKLQAQNASLPTTLMGGCAPQTKELNEEQSVNVDDSSERDNTLNNATSTLNSDNSLFENITQIASKGVEEIVEPIYITEYFTTMYSYYTIDKTGTKDSSQKWETKEKEKLISLSNYDLTQDVIYRAEAEYILWGNKDDARKNVNTTKAVIFAIQFIGNLTFALTNAEVTKGADTIGDLFPHKIVSLVVQVVVEVVVATVETVRDMVVLCNGGKVVLFKSMASNPKEEWRSDFNFDTIAGIVPCIKKWDMTKDETSKDAIAFSYKDYLWIMLCAGCLNETNRYVMLERAADLSQVNVAKSEGIENYKLMDKSTMLQINANVEMDTWLVTDVFNNNNNLGLDTSGKYTMKYRGIQGY